MSEFWTKTCEKCRREFDVGVWTHKSTLCHRCKTEENLNPALETCEGYMNEEREVWRDSPVMPSPDSDVDPRKEYLSEDLTEVMQDSFYETKKKHGE